MIAAIEGLPGAGKTTTTEHVANRLGVVAVQETTGDHPFLRQVYDDSDRDDLTVELAFLIVHANAYRRIDHAGATLADFAPAKDLLFAEDMLQGSEFAFFRQAYNLVYQGHEPPDLVVYLRADPQLCMARIRARYERDPRRLFEQGLTLERLARMYERYEAGIDRLGRQVVECDVAAGDTEDAVADRVDSILRAQHFAAR